MIIEILFIINARSGQYGLIPTGPGRIFLKYRGNTRCSEARLPSGRSACRASSCLIAFTWMISLISGYAFQTLAR
jgi:hypothetical protein